jgi:Protein phosphatase 2C
MTEHAPSAARVSQGLQFAMLSAASRQINDYNDDAFGAAPGRLWVLDGATGVADTRLTRGASDASWLAHATAALLASAHWDGFASEALLAGLEQFVRAAFECEAAWAGAAPAGTAEMPSTCLGLVQLRPEHVEVACVGDVSVVVQAPGAPPQVFSDNAAAPFSQRTLQAWRQARAAGAQQAIAPGEVLEAVRPVIRENRKAMNQPGGYRVIHPLLPWARGVTVHRIARLAGTRVLLASDGLWRLVDLFGTHTPQSLLDAAAAEGIDALIAQVRRLEAADAHCEHAPRVKASDDATGLLASLLPSEGGGA